jgi:hypothetical protein
MANVKITDLTAYTNPASTDVLPIVDVGADVTKKVSIGEVVGKISGDVDVATDGTSSITAGAVSTTELGGDITAAGKALLDAAAQRTTLGLATVASTGAYSDLSGTPTLVTQLDDLTDVDVTTTPPNDGEALVWDNGASEWVPGSAGATAAGSANEIQYNDGASGLAASSDLTWDDTGKELGVGGDINLDDGGTYATTLQMVTATANRTISFPDATGTVALVAGSNGQVTYNNTGAQAGGNLSYDATTGTFGYGSGRGTVTQQTNKSTGVTLNAPCGAITMNGAALNADTTVTFTLTNSSIAANDLLVLNHISGGTAGSYVLNAQAAAGSASINVTNISTGSLSEAIVIDFAIIKS